MCGILHYGKIKPSNERSQPILIIIHKNKNIMIQFTIDSFSGGISGRPYKSIKDAIQDGGYSVWCNEKIKKAFSFGNGTEKDFKRYCKDNLCKIISESEFYSLPLKEQRTHIQFIREQLSLYNDL